MEAQVILQDIVFVLLYGSVIGLSVLAAIYVLRNAAERNVINVSKMMRYARRRHIDSELQKDLNEIGL